MGDPRSLLWRLIVSEQRFCSIHMVLLVAREWRMARAGNGSRLHVSKQEQKLML
jgi:hypothetical protein